MICSSVVCPFVLFLLANVLHVLLQFTVSDYSFDFCISMHIYVCHVGLLHMGLNRFHRGHAAYLYESDSSPNGLLYHNSADVLILLKII